MMRDNVNTSEKMGRKNTHGTKEAVIQIPPKAPEYMIISDISCQLFDNKQAGVSIELLSKLTYGQRTHMS